jgi:hypothetical protein
MAVYKFGENDVFINTLEAYPETSFYIHSGTVVIDSISNLSGAHQPNILHVSDGHISLYEVNIDRLDGNANQITGSIVADGFMTTANELQANNYGVDYIPDNEEPGNLQIDLSYNLSSSVYRYYYPEVAVAPYDHGANVEVGGINNISAPANGRLVNGYRNFELEETVNNPTQVGYPVPFSIQSVLDKYSFLSPHYKISSSAPMHHRDFRRAEMSLINIPSIFYGAKIKRGTVELNYYVSGSLIATLRDQGKRGELKQTYPSDHNYSGSVAGIILYQEGLIMLTGSWQIENDNSIAYLKDDGTSTGATTNKWTHFGSGLHRENHDSANQHSASFGINFQGTTRIPTMTMLCPAPYSELNWSNNPTFIDHSSSNVGTFNHGSYHYIENEVPIANITDTDLVGYIPEQVKETYISKVAIYDEKKNLIGVAKVANPVRKTPDRSYLFKLKLDL